VLAKKEVKMPQKKEGGQIAIIPKMFALMSGLHQKNYKCLMNIVVKMAYRVRRGCVMELKPSTKNKGSGAMLANKLHHFSPTAEHPKDILHEILYHVRPCSFKVFCGKS